MKITKLAEAGYNEAILGLSLSFYDHQIPLEEFWTEGRRQRAIQRAKALAFKGGGHNKFLASVFTWWLIEAPRFFLSEYDTYKVGTTANSSSTMHTLDKRLVTAADFEVGTSQTIIDGFNSEIRRHWASPDISRLKANLPEGWLQERQVCINYMTLQNILSQRAKHRLPQWQKFCSAVLAQVSHPELLLQTTKI
jgi:hypothetical protein